MHCSLPTTTLPAPSFCNQRRLPSSFGVETSPTASSPTMGASFSPLHHPGHDSPELMFPIEGLTSAPPSHSTPPSIQLPLQILSRPPRSNSIVISRSSSVHAWCGTPKTAPVVTSSGDRNTATGRCFLAPPPTLGHRKSALQATALPKLFTNVRIGSHEVEVQTPRQTPQDGEMEAQLDMWHLDHHLPSSSSTTTTITTPSTPPTTVTVSPSQSAIHHDINSFNHRRSSSSSCRDSSDTDDEKECATEENMMRQNTIISVKKSKKAQKKMCLMDFEILSLIGEGNFGKVFLVEKINTGMVYAMKVMKKTDVIRKKVVKSTRTERDVLVAMDHPFIVNLRFSFQTLTKLYLIMDYIPGGEILNKIPFAREDTARFYIAEIVLAIEHLHSRDIIYRDLKPENVLIHSDGHVCLTDFGLVKEDISGEVRTASFCGTLHYMAPEMVKNSSYGKSADWWAVGCLLHEFLVGDSPFTGTRKQIMRSILKKKIKFPKYVRLDSQMLIKGLLERRISKRLGCTSEGVDAIKKHRYFRTIDWKKLEQKQTSPPCQPKLTSPRDTSCFDDEFTSKRNFKNSPKTPIPKPSDQLLFRGFSYTFAAEDYDEQHSLAEEH